MAPDQVERASPTIHCDRALARRLEMAEGRSNAEFVVARAKAFPEIGCLWTKIAGAYAMFDGAESPCTQTFGLGLFDPVTASEMSDLERFFTDRGADVFHEVSPLADLGLLALLGERGYRPIEWSTVLFRPLAAVTPGAAVPDATLQVRRIKSTEHDLWARIGTAGWADVAPELGEYLQSLARVNPHRSNTHCFLVEKQGAPMAAGALCLFDNVAVLAGACTMPKWRKQGAQAALLDHRLRFAAEHGCNISMVVALPGSDSQRNAERQGFRVAYTRTKWRLACE